MHKKIIFLSAIMFVFSTVRASAVIQSPKKGVAGGYYPNAAQNTPPRLQQVGVNWFYDWNAEQYEFQIARNSCTEFVPLISYHASDDYQESYINSVTQSGLYWLIGNEPDWVLGGCDNLDSDGTKAQCDGISGYQLLDNYVEYARKIKAHDGSAKLIFGGFLTAGQKTDPQKPVPPAYYMAELLYQRLIANDIHPDGWAIHMYNCCNTTNGFEYALEQWKNVQNTRLGGIETETWITELGKLGTDAGMETWMENVVNYMETNTNPSLKVDRYAWFSLMTYLKDDGTPKFGDIGLYNASGSISNLGTKYSSLPTSSLSTPQPCTPGLITTQTGWNKITLTENRTNILNNCVVSSKRGQRWKIFKTSFNTLKPYYAKCH